MDSVLKAGLLKLFVLAVFQSAAAVVQIGGDKNVELFMEKIQIRRAVIGKKRGKYYKDTGRELKKTQVGNNGGRKESLGSFANLMF